MCDIKEKIKKIINEEIAGAEVIENSHGISLERCLVEPYEVICEDSFEEGSYISLYAVLKEAPSDEDCYHIIYDPLRNLFGLSIPGNNGRIFLGYYGSFLETLRGM
jgi:hypothetical protein